MTLTPDAIAGLLRPYVVPEASADWPGVYGRLAAYLDLILKWNARTNLTAIRTPEEIVRRHFGESLFAGGHLGACRTLLDFGSGAGFPGIPIQLLRPELAVTLAESQGKKAAFLREAVRTLGLNSEVWAGRVEAMPAERRFEAVALRAVDTMDAAVVEAGRRASGRVVILGSRTAEYSALAGKFGQPVLVPLPESNDSALLIYSHR